MNGHATESINDGTFRQSDEVIWKKVHKNLMNIGVPVTPILVRRAKGVSMYVSQCLKHNYHLEATCRLKTCTGLKRKGDS